MGELFENILILVFVLQALWSLFRRLFGKGEKEASDEVEFIEEFEDDEAVELEEWLRHAGRQLDEALALGADLDSRVDDLNRKLRDPTSGALQTLKEVIESPVRAELQQTRGLIEHGAAARAQGAEAFYRRADALRQAYEALRIARIRVEVLELMVRWRFDRQLGGHLADADAMAEVSAMTDVSTCPVGQCCLGPRTRAKSSSS